MAESSEVKLQNSIPSDLLDDIASRFLLDASEAVLSDPISLCFKTEQAYWFYLDEYVEEDKSLKTLKLDLFAIQLLKHVRIQPPIGGTLENMLQEFREFKMKVPTYGGILLNDDLTQVLLAQGFCQNNTWGFPKGKINVGEEPHKCAIREVLEETGYDISELIQPTVFLETTIGERLERLYIIEGVPMDTKFVPKTKGEIKELKWFQQGQLPANKAEKHSSSVKMLYMALPFVKPLREWISREMRGKSKKKARRCRKRNKSVSNGAQAAESQRDNCSPSTPAECVKKLFANKSRVDIAPKVDKTSKRLRSKTTPDRPQSQPLHNIQDDGHISNYFSSSAWRTFRLDKNAINQVLDEFFRTII